MIKDKTENWYYFPEKITVGKAKYGKKTNFCDSNFDAGCFAFVTCRYKNMSWVSATRFKTICGYSPANIRDSAKQFEKLVTGVVSEFDNIPVGGFRLVSYDDIDKMGNVETRGVTVFDPRGFTIFMKYVDFFELLKNSGISQDGYISGKYAYGWDCNTHMKLLREDSPEYLTGIEKSRQFGKSDGFVTKKDLIKGHTYVHIGTGGGITYMMYLGEFQTYGLEYHLEFLETGKYRNIADFKQDLKEHYANSRMTTHKSMVFYRFDSSEPYVIKDSISRFFEREAAASEFEIPTMYNSSALPANFENIMSDIAEHPLFNKLSSGFGKLERVSADTLLNIFARHCYEINVKKRLSSFYFNNWTYNDIVLISSKRSGSLSEFILKKIKSCNAYARHEQFNINVINAVEKQNELTGFFSSKYYVQTACEYSYTGESVDDIMSKYEFWIPSMTYESGKRVPQEYAIAFYANAMS